MSGGERLSLRYDLTVPFARFLAHNKHVKRVKRYQVGKVYRKEQPCMASARLREFTQCDFDVACRSEDMIADAECLHVLHDVFRCLHLKRALIRVSHRAILEGMFAACGVPARLRTTISHCIDRLDKSSLARVQQDMRDKGLDAAAVASVSTFICMRGSAQLVQQLLHSRLAAHADAKRGLEQLRSLFTLSRVMGLEHVLRLDLSLARGLDYYTGIIFEAVLLDSPRVGAIAAGGRYDALVGLLSPSDGDRCATAVMAAEKREQVPCVGLSIGVDRILAANPDPSAGACQQRHPSHCYVASIGSGLLEERFRLLVSLWDAGLSADHSCKRAPRLLDQIQDCESWGIPLILIIGQDELRQQQVKLRYVASREELLVPRHEILDTVRRVLKQMGRL